jgi:hypothetical protein
MYFIKNIMMQLKILFKSFKISFMELYRKMLPEIVQLNKSEIVQLNKSNPINLVQNQNKIKLSKNNLKISLIK